MGHEGPLSEGYTDTNVKGLLLGFAFVVVWMALGTSIGLIFGAGLENSLGWSFMLLIGFMVLMLILMAVGSLVSAVRGRRRGTGNE